MWSVEYLLEVVKSITYNLICLVITREPSLVITKSQNFYSYKYNILNVYKILALIFLVLLPKHYCHILF